MSALENALSFDLFEGDFGDQGDKILRDKIVKARKPGECHICGQQVKPGTMIRSLTARWAADGLMSYRTCAECTEACARSKAGEYDDETEDDPVDARYAIRFENERQSTP